MLDTDDLSVELITHDEMYEVYKQGYLFGNVKFYKNELYVWTDNGICFPPEKLTPVFSGSRFTPYDDFSGDLSEETMFCNGDISLSFQKLNGRYVNKLALFGELYLVYITQYMTVMVDTIEVCSCKPFLSSGKVLDNLRISYIHKYKGYCLVHTCITYASFEGAVHDKRLILVFNKSTFCGAFSLRGSFDGVGVINQEVRCKIPEFLKIGLALTVDTFPSRVFK